MTLNNSHLTLGIVSRTGNVKLVKHNLLFICMIYYCHLNKNFNLKHYLRSIANAAFTSKRNLINGNLHFKTDYINTSYKKPDFLSILIIWDITTITLHADIWLVVNVPVLSEQMTDVQPSVSTEGKLLTMAFFLAILLVPRARQVVMTAGRPSGMAATAKATAILK